MKRISLLLALTGALVTYQSSALPVNETRLAGYFTYAGGEFDETPTAPNAAFSALVAENYVAGKTSIDGGIETFCIQLNVGILNNPLNATWPNLPAPDAGVSYLYRQFVAGTLVAGTLVYDYTDVTPTGSGLSGRAQSALELQMAIWKLQGFSWSDIASEESGIATPLNFTDAQKYVDLGLANPGNYNVDALSLTAANGAESQEMLIAVPDGGSAVMLLGIAMSGLVMVSRKLRKA